MVKYVGRSHSRIIREADWAKMGIEQGDVEWNASNRYEVPADELAPEALAFLIDNPGEWQATVTPSPPPPEVDDQIEFDELDPED